MIIRVKLFNLLYRWFFLHNYLPSSAFSQCLYRLNDTIHLFTGLIHQITFLHLTYNEIFGILVHPVVVFTGK